MKNLDELLQNLPYIYIDLEWLGAYGKGKKEFQHNFKEDFWLDFTVEVNTHFFDADIKVSSIILWEDGMEIEISQNEYDLIEQAIIDNTTYNGY